MDMILRAMEDYAAEYNVPVIGKDSAKLLAATVVSRRPVSILEIGTAIGYSTLIIAGYMPSDGHITTIEISAERAAVAQQFFNRSDFAGRIDVLVGDAAQIIPNLDGVFDLVFIDAAKGQYLNYLLKCLKMLSPGAIIIADNVLFRGFVRGNNSPRRYRTIVKRLREYLQFVSDDCRFTTTVYPVGDGVAISLYQEESSIEKN